MKITILSSKGYEDKTTNYGDCILIDSGSELVIFDCGSIEHANRVIDYMKKANYSSAKFVLSHNDADHFEGLPTLIDSGLISKVYTLLLLKYKSELLELIGDGRITDESLTRKIKDKYDNIYSLGDLDTELVDALTLPNICTGVKIVGPGKTEALTAVAKLLDSRDGDTIDDETIHNAICFQVQIAMDGNKHFLISGDSAYSPLENNLKSAEYIQLPHHGKPAIAEKIFELKDQDKNLNFKYYVSDNTGDSNGGSDGLNEVALGHHVQNTKTGDIVVDTSYIRSPYVPHKSYGVNV